MSNQRNALGRAATADKVLALSAPSSVCQHASYNSLDDIRVVVVAGFDGAGAGLTSSSLTSANLDPPLLDLGISLAANASRLLDDFKPDVSLAAPSVINFLLNSSLGSAAEVDGESCSGFLAERSNSAIGELGASAALASCSTRDCAAASAASVVTGAGVGGSGTAADVLRARAKLAAEAALVSLLKSGAMSVAVEGME